MATNTPPYINPYYKPSNEPKRVTLDRNIFEKNDGSSVVVIEKQKSMVERDMFNEEKPEVPFSSQFFMVNHDPRLVLSTDTYVQMIMGAGLKVKVKQPNLDKKIQRWVNRIEMEKKVENGLFSYIETGNMMFEVAPHFSEIEEIDMATIIFAQRDKEGDITNYVQEINMRPNNISADVVTHFKLTDVRKEVWGRGMYHALFAAKPELDMEAPLLSQWKMEDAMVKIFEGYASPLMMIHFEDAGEQWIKKQETAFRKMKQGAKVLTDKKFEAEVMEVAPQSKFDKYVDHRQTNLIETGAQFPLGFFNGEFANRAASETSDSVLGRKVKRIQKKVAAQIKKDWVMAYIKELGVKVDDSDVTVMFEIESKSEVGNDEMLQLFLNGGITRGELRKHLVKKTTVELDEEDMEDTPPITSTTPTNDLRTSQPSPAAQGLTPQQQDSQLAQMQAQMETLQELIQTKIPKPRGRPKKQEILATLPEIQSNEDLENRLRFHYPDMPEADLMQLVKLMSPIFFDDTN